MFKRSEDSCAELVIPENAHIGYSGSDWTCNPGFRRQGQACAPDGV